MTHPVPESMYNVVPEQHKNAREVTKGAVLPTILKRLEDEFVKRGMVQRPASAAFYPLWFLAETEKNVFLWRHQLSLGDAQRFEFWVDPFALIEKRRSQIMRGGEQTSFGITDASTKIVSDEFEYLAELEHHLRKIFSHAEAFSAAASQVLRECTENSSKNCVRLPASS